MPQARFDFQIIQHNSSLLCCLKFNAIQHREHGYTQREGKLALGLALEATEILRQSPGSDL